MKFQIIIKSVKHAVAYNGKGDLVGEVCKLISSEPTQKEFVVLWGAKAPRQSKSVNSLNEGIKYLEKVLTK